MKRLFFILLSLFIVNLKIYGENYSVEYANIVAEMIEHDTKKCFILTTQKYDTLEHCSSNPINIMIGSQTTINLEDKEFKINIPNIQNQIKLKLDIIEKQLLINYTCVNGYTNQYYPNALETYYNPLPQKSKYDKGCFKYVRYCSDLNDCGIDGEIIIDDNDKKLVKITKITETEQITETEHILLVQDNTLTTNNLKWCDSDGVGPNVKCGTGGG